MPVWLRMQADSGRFDRSKRRNSSNNKKSRQRSSSPRVVDTRSASSPSLSSISSSSFTSTASTSSFSSSPSSSSSSSSSSLHTQDSSSLHRRKSEMVASHGLPGVRRQSLPKALSEPHISCDLSPDKSGSLKVDRDSRQQSFCLSENAQFTARRCMTDYSIQTATDYSIQTAKAPDLLQLFNIFQFNTAELPPARMLVNVTLVGSIQGIRLLVDCDASVQDVIKVALKAFAKEGRLPRYSYKHQTYGLHFSPFCLESINPGEAVSSLGTRSFYLSPSSQISPDVSEDSGEGKSWWKVLSFLFT